MNSNELKNNMWMVIAVAVAVGLIAGYGIWGSPKNASLNMSNTMNMSSDSSSDTRLSLNTLLRGHAAMGATTLISLYDGKDVSELKNLMMANGEEIKAIIVKVYGEDKGNKFSELWMKHMDEYENYTTAEKNEDSDGMNKAIGNLDIISGDLGNLLQSKSLPAQAVTALFKEHVQGTLKIVDAHAKGDDKLQADLMKSGYDQAGVMADTLASGMIADQTSKK